MEWTPESLDLVFGATQFFAGLFLVYGAWLAIREAGLPQTPAEPASGSAAPQKRPALGSIA